MSILQGLGVHFVGMSTLNTGSAHYNAHGTAVNIVAPKTRWILCCGSSGTSVQYFGISTKSMLFKQILLYIDTATLQCCQCCCIQRHPDGGGGDGCLKAVGNSRNSLWPFCFCLFTFWMMHLKFSRLIIQHWSIFSEF